MKPVNDDGHPNVNTGGHREAVAATTLVLALALVMPRAGLADDAAVLPRGVSRFNLDVYHYLPTTHRYNADGDRETLASPFDDAPLDSIALSILEPFDALVGGTAKLGDVAVDYEYDIDVLDIGYAYGLTDNFSLGFHVPYYWIKNNVDIAFDNSGANLGFDPGGGPFPFASIASGGIPLTEDDVQNLVQSEYGFDKVDSWSRDGIGDIELGARYRIHAARDSALAFTGGLRIPTGYEDDADKLDDVAWSYGNYAMLFRLQYDYLLSNRWKTVTSDLQGPIRAQGDLVLNLTFRYDYMLADKKIMRVGDTPGQTFTNNRERVDRDLGDIVNLELSTRYWSSDALSFGATYTYGFKSKDSIDGDKGFNYSSLEADTDFEEQIVIVESSYSTLAAYREKQSPAPMEFSIAYRERFAGKGPQSGQVNPRLYTRWIVIGMDLLF